MLSKLLQQKHDDLLICSLHILQEYDQVDGDETDEDEDSDAESEDVNQSDSADDELESTDDDSHDSDSEEEVKENPAARKKPTKNSKPELKVKKKTSKHGACCSFMASWSLQKCVCISRICNQ